LANKRLFEVILVSWVDAETRFAKSSASITTALLGAALTARVRIARAVSRELACQTQFTYQI
jgi:hypothetical protein